MRGKGLDPKNVFQALGVFFKRLHTTGTRLKKNAFLGDFGVQEAFGVPGGCTYGVGARKI